MNIQTTRKIGKSNDSEGIPVEIMTQYVFMNIPVVVDSRLIKSADPIKRVMLWNKIPIGVSHDAGDKRHGRSLRAGYGHIRGSYGDAEDGMSIDVYIGADLGSREVFRVKQVKPETDPPELDEYKYFIGCYSAQEVEDLYLSCMPKRFFGGVEKVSLNRLKKYQR